MFQFVNRKKKMVSVVTDLIKKISRLTDLFCYIYEMILLTPFQWDNLGVFFSLFVIRSRIE